MKQFLSVSVLFLFVFIFIRSPLRADNKNFGSIKMVLNSNDSLELDVQTALLYRNVHLAYDSTLQIQNQESLSVKYYPQFENGNQNILRILAGEILTVEPQFYDIFFVVGDTIPDSLAWKDTSATILMIPNGYVTASRSVSENINGYIKFDRDKKGNVISGNLKVDFNTPIFGSPGGINQVYLAGAFKLAVGTYRELALSKSESDVDKKKRGRQNLYLGIVFAVFIIAIFGFR
jgi:hypothetical protein